MRKVVLKIALIFLLLFQLIVEGCKKDENLYFNSIIGKWKYIYTTGGIVITYPREGDIMISEFTKDGRLIKSLNDSVVFETDFHVSGDTLKYHLETDLFYKIKIYGDTLGLIYIQYGMNHYYKKVK